MDIRFSARAPHTLPCAAAGWIGNRVFKAFLESSMNGKMHSIVKVTELSGYAAEVAIPFISHDVFLLSMDRQMVMRTVNIFPVALFTSKKRNNCNPQHLPEYFQSELPLPFKLSNQSATATISFNSWVTTLALSINAWTFSGNVYLRRVFWIQVVKCDAYSWAFSLIFDGHYGSL